LDERVSLQLLRNPHTDITASDDEDTGATKLAGFRHHRINIVMIYWEKWNCSTK